jgi:hypothetical protein
MGLQAKLCLAQLCRYQLLLIVEIILSDGCWLLKKKLAMSGGEKAMWWREVTVN